MPSYAHGVRSAVCSSVRFLIGQLQESCSLFTGVPFLFTLWEQGETPAPTVTLNWIMMLKNGWNFSFYIKEEKNMICLTLEILKTCFLLKLTSISGPMATMEI